MHEFKVGELVYFNSIRGLVKGKITNKEWPKIGIITPNSQKITVRVTSKNHPIYK